MARGGPEAVAAELNQFAAIDGFNPLLGAAEQDAADAIRVLHRFGADLEARTSPVNPIIPGASALHLAAFYGRVNAAVALLELGAQV